MNGLTSQHLRQCLLENNELTVDKAFEIAGSLHMAQECSDTHAAERSLFAAVSSSQQATDVSDPSLPVEKLSSAATTAPKVARKCYFCGQLYHCRDQCSAKDATCYVCGKSSHCERAKTRQTLLDLHICCSSFSYFVLSFSLFNICCILPRKSAASLFTNFGKRK